MEFQLPLRFKKSFKGPCEQINAVKRPICIGANIEQRPWQPTIRKAAINNQFMRGKPAFNSIPSYLGANVVDSKKKSAPAYSLGRKITIKRKDANDGPNKWNVRGLCNRGLQTAPAYSLKFRTPVKEKFQTPSASKYSIENSFKATTTTIPKFSFGKRPIVLKTIPTPAPNVYSLPAVFGTAKQGQIKAAPAFTMLGRAKPRQILDLIPPGPGNYENNYRLLQKQSPLYSLYSKRKVMSDEHMKPGPASHCPEKYIKHKSVPAASFSIQHSPFLGQQKAYLIPECKIANKPAWQL